MGASGDIVLYGLGSTALFGIVFWILNKISGGKATEILAALLKKKETRTPEEVIRDVTKEEKVIVGQIKAAEEASEESKKKIQDKIRKTAVEVNEILKEDNITKIDEQIDEDWKKL